MALPAALVLGLAATAGAAAAGQPCQPGSGCLSRLPLGSGAQLPYYATYPLSGATEVTGAVVVIHGTGRNAEGYFQRMVKAAGDFGLRTTVIAPRFQTKDDKPAQRDAYWTNGGEQSWKDGGNAVKPAALSSFEAMDDILRALADRSRFPRLTKVTIAGHSAGGQFVQRYAAGSSASAILGGIGVEFVVANPSSYLYLDTKRPLGDGLGSCRDSDDYKYGLQRRNPYMAKPSAEEIRAQYSAREVTYLLGEKDVLQDDSLDTSCAAKAQGKNRFERGRNYAAAIARLFPSAPHRAVTVPGVGHDSEAMFTPRAGRSAFLHGW